MTTAQVVETSATVNNNNPIQDYVHPDDQTQPTLEMTPGFKPFTKISELHISAPYLVYLNMMWTFKVRSNYFSFLSNLTLLANRKNG